MADPNAPLNAGDYGIIQVGSDWGWVGWLDEANQMAHTLPVSDVAGHALHPSCVCGPAMPFPGHVVHNSFDGREAYEMKLRKPH